MMGFLGMGVGDGCHRERLGINDTNCWIFQDRSKVTGITLGKWGLE